MRSVSTHIDPTLRKIIRLQNGDMAAEVATDFGSNLISLTYSGEELIHMDKGKLLKNGYTGCFVLYPFPNRIRNRRFSFEGTTYELTTYPQKGGDEPLIHGISHDAQWSVLATDASDESAVSVTTAMDWNDGQEFFHLFPLPSQLQLTYTLSSTGLRVEYQVHNNGSKNMPFGFALHPSFKRLSGDQTTISIPARSVMRMDSQLLPTGEELPVETVMFRQFDLRKPVPVTAALRLDHVFTDIISETPIILDHPTKDISLHVSFSDDCRYIVFHTLGGDRTVEIEPQTCATDALNATDPVANGLLVLAPNERHSGFIEYTIRSGSNT